MLTILLRFAHVFFGALWVGMMTFQVFFLAPTLTEMGPDAGKVMAGMMKRRIPVIMPIFALIAIISGMWLFQRISGGNMAALMATPMGKGFAAGGAIALLAFLIGIVVMRPAMMRSMKLMQEIASAPPDRRPGMQAEIQKIRARGEVLGKVVTVMLLLTLGLMAVARYL
ncbi:MAG: hypothetical protein ACM358_06385 [Gemmatimonadota bacterium]